MPSSYRCWESLEGPMRTIPKGQGFYKWLEAQDMSGGSCFSFPAQCKVECQQVTLHG